MDLIPCPRHRNQKILFLYLLPDHVEILCEICFEDNIIKSEQLQINKLISINTILQKPETMFKKLDLDSNLQNFFQNNQDYSPSLIIEQIKDMEKQIQIIQEQIQKMLEEFKICIQNIENLRRQFIAESLNGYNFEQFQQLLMGLVQQKDVINPDAIVQLKLRVHQYFQQLQKENTGQEANNTVFTKIYETSNSIDQEIQKLQTLDQLKSKIEKFHNAQYEIATSIYPHIIKQLQSTLFTSYQQYKIINSVKERQKCEIQDIKLIFLGSGDGLNAQSFWAKVNGKKNLLMIFKSKSNYIFGAYSPCQWQQNLNGYVQDNTKSSFLFSQTHDEIYPKNHNIYAIYCSSNNGPAFGNGLGFDLTIAANFQDGHSKLGSEYKWDKYQGQMSTHLFGQSTPDIIECEIFEILFK